MASLSVYTIKPKSWKMMTVHIENFLDLHLSLSWRVSAVIFGLVSSWSQLKSQARAYFEESRWRDEKYVPTLEEHLGVSKMSTTYPLLASAILVGMGEVATKEAFEWAASFPKIVDASSAIGRIMNDITSYEVINPHDFPHSPVVYGLVMWWASES